MDQDIIVSLAEYGTGSLKKIQYNSNGFEIAGFVEWHNPEKAGAMGGWYDCNNLEYHPVVNDLQKTVNE